jgi:predicted thioesterase
MAQIPLGLKGSSRIVVTNENAISFLGRDDARVLATPWLIMYMEMTCRDGVKSFLSDAEDTVGTQVTVAHLAASPIGSEVHFEAEVIRVDGNRVEFRVQAQDAAGLVGEGTHERAIINIERFAERIRKRKG